MGGEAGPMVESQQGAKSQRKSRERGNTLPTLDVVCKGIEHKRLPTLQMLVASLGYSTEGAGHFVDSVSVRQSGTMDGSEFTEGVRCNARVGCLQ